MSDDPTADDAAPRRGRAGRVRRLWALPAALPDVPRDGRGDRIAPRADRGDARGQRGPRAARRRVHRRDGRVHPVPRLRGRVPVGRAVRSPHGGHPHRARAAAVAGRAASSRPSRSAACSRTGGCSAPRPAPLAVGQRLHLVPRRFGLPRLPVRPPAPLTADTDPDVYLFTGCVMDAWQRDVHRAALRAHAGHRRARRSARGRAATAAARCTPTPVAAPTPCGSHAGSSTRSRATRRSSSTARGAAPRSPTTATSSAPTRPARSRRGSSTSPPGSRPGRCPSSPAGTPTVVVQDPCHLRHVQHAHLPVAALLGRAYDVRLTADDGLCCGAGGAYSAFEPELSRGGPGPEGRRAAAAAAGGRPFVVASANPGCALHLARGRARPSAIPVELLEDCLGPD